MYRVVATVFIPGIGEVTFTSEPMSEDWVRLTLFELSNGPFKVLKARSVPSEG